MLRLRGISKSSLIVALYRPFPSPVTASWIGDPWAFPRASHPTDQEPATHVAVGTGRTRTRSYVFDIRRTSSTSTTGLDRFSGVHLRRSGRCSRVSVRGGPVGAWECQGSGCCTDIVGACQARWVINFGVSSWVSAG